MNKKYRSKITADVILIIVIYIIYYAIAALSVRKYGLRWIIPVASFPLALIFIFLVITRPKKDEQLLMKYLVYAAIIGLIVTLLAYALLRSRINRYWGALMVLLAWVVLSILVMQTTAIDIKKLNRNHCL